ncbi:hypothetical protein Glove_319g151 [Diversispora epigaea]|uniref:Uncharacterized protein n=1 Tax=Diversispora epigaea TaxID=1348612 RepID=A0A397HPB6_9GLOM|nr:hypothetical protein Glove_319g151 [Diversispora epigaea]
MISQFLSLERNFRSVEEKGLKEKHLPLQIGWHLSVETIDAFFERHETPGYKFDIDSKGNVFIVEMGGPEHTTTIKILNRFFNVPNGAIIRNSPIGVEVNSAHYRPHGGGNLSSSDLAIRPNLNIIPRPLPPPLPPQRRRFGCTVRPRPYRHLEIPPVDRGGRPHARIMCEIAVSQSYDDLKAKCNRWMLQEYVRCVLGIKIYKKRVTRNATGQFDRCMIAILWSRPPARLPRQVAVPRQSGVFTEEWNFGTINYHDDRATTCIAPNLPNYQITIPVREVFWNPPIVGGVPNTARYAPVVPAGVAIPNFIIDLFDIQQEVLENQDNVDFSYYFDKFLPHVLKNLYLCA